MFASPRYIFGTSTISVKLERKLATALFTLQLTSQAIRGPAGLLPATSQSATVLSDDCPAQDDGAYIPVDQMYHKPDPQLKYVEGCQKAEFQHIDNYFDTGI